MKERAWGAIIPAYNAAATLPTVLAGVKRHISPDDILVIDDGSGDDTAKVAELSGVQVLHRDTNGGKGRALREGYSWAATAPLDWLICLDADGQHDPRIIPDFQQKASLGKFDLIIGDRTGELTGMPLSRRFSNFTSSALLSWRLGQKLPDVQCGYRAIKMEALKNLKFQALSYDIEVEMIWQAFRLGLGIGWVPIPTVYQQEISHLRKFPETLRFIRFFARTFYER